MNKADKFERLDVDLILSVAKIGSGYYLRIPKDILDAFNLSSGDKVKAKLLGVKRWEPKE